MEFERLLTGFIGALKNDTMKLNAGIITSKLKEAKGFYIHQVGFGITH